MPGGFPGRDESPPGHEVSIPDSTYEMVEVINDLQRRCNEFREPVPLSSRIETYADLKNDILAVIETVTMQAVELPPSAVSSIVIVWDESVGRVRTKVEEANFRRTLDMIEATSPYEKPVMVEVGFYIDVAHDVHFPNGSNSGRDRKTGGKQALEDWDLETKVGIRGY